MQLKHAGKKGSDSNGHKNGETQANTSQVATAMAGNGATNGTPMTIQLPKEMMASLPPILTTSVEEIEADVDRAIAALDGVRAQVKWRYTYVPAALLVSNGHFKEGEVEAINSILLAGDKNPSFFSALAHIDGGVDPKVFETAPTKGNLRRRAAVVRLTEYLATFGSSFDDSAVRIGEAIHEVTAPAYELAKVVAKNHETSRSDLATALIFHARSARTRQRNAKSIEGGLQKQIRLLRAKYRKELREKIHELIAQAAAIPSRRSFRTTSALGRLSPAA